MKIQNLFLEEKKTKTKTNKHCWKNTKCWLPAFFPFPNCFQSFSLQIYIFKSLLFCCPQILPIWTSVECCHMAMHMQKVSNNNNWSSPRNISLSVKFPSCACPRSTLPSGSVNHYPFPKQALVFTCLQLKSFKTLWEREKSLVTSNFSFSHSAF